MQLVLTIFVQLLNDEIELDPRPEYARATITSKNGKLFAEITGDQVRVLLHLISCQHTFNATINLQISSRLQSIDGADVLLHLPAATDAQATLCRGQLLHASVLKNHFISGYADW